MTRVALRGKMVQSGALSICVTKPVVPVGNFSEKKGIPSEVYLFSRFSRNDRKISVPFAATNLFPHRARSANEPKNAKIYHVYPFNRFKLIQNSFKSSERFSLKLSPRLHEDGRFS